MTVETVTVGPFEENCYLVVDGESRAAVLVDPGDDGRWVEVRGHVAETSEAGAVEDINRLARKYTGADFRVLNSGEVRVTYKIMPDKVVVGS